MANQILIFDIGKTNKKLLVFNEEYQVVHEYSESLDETKDEDGFSCEDVYRLTNWIKDQAEIVLSDNRFNIKAINFSAYGASFVYLDKNGDVIPPLYNYLKPISQNLLENFYSENGGREKICTDTCSPALGNLNSGMQILRLKIEHPEKFSRIRYALHLPQYLSYLFTHHHVSDLTSIGCHTMLWDFKKMNYHSWLVSAQLEKLFPENKPSSEVYETTTYKNSKAGIGLHDSSSALIPYLKRRKSPFILLSTGTWCIALNPFTSKPLTEDELRQDCLCYLSYEGLPVKASRLFLGLEHQVHAQSIANHFNLDDDFFLALQFDSSIQYSSEKVKFIDEQGLIHSGFEKRDLTRFSNAAEAYHTLVHDMVISQIDSLFLIQPDVSGWDILVDGGFAKNELYMSMLKKLLPLSSIHAAEVPQASAIGAAMAIHDHWNSLPFDQATKNVH